MASSERPVAVYGALAADLAIAAIKLAVSAVSGSSAMFSEGIHSVVDSGNQLLLLLGLTLAGTALFLASETRGLLVGETAGRSLVRSVRSLAAADPAVARVERALTMQLGPDQVLLNLEVIFRGDLPASEVAEAIDRIERAIRAAHPEVLRIFIEAEAITGAKRG